MIISNLKIMDLLILLIFEQIYMTKKNIKDIDKEWKRVEQEEMKEEDHQLELKDGYEQDENYEDSED
jgi:hypothetical protein